MNRTQGFTLIELLITLGLIGIILVAVTNLINSSARDNMVTGANADVLREGQIAQQLISGRLSEAIYIYPPTMPLSMILGNGPSTLNTVGPSTGQNWRVGIDPFVAMILPPRNPKYDASTGAITNCGTMDGNSANSDGCYRFYAYYPMLRSSLISSSLSASEKPRSDPVNDSQWVLMEYRAMLFSGASNWTPCFNVNRAISKSGCSDPSAMSGLPAIGYYQSRSAALVVDYVQPRSVTFTVTPPTTPGVANGSVNFSFAVRRVAQGVTLNASTNALGARVSPRSWRCDATCTLP